MARPRRGQSTAEVNAPASSHVDHGGGNSGQGERDPVPRTEGADVESAGSGEGPGQAGIPVKEQGRDEIENRNCARGDDAQVGDFGTESHGGDNRVGIGGELPFGKADAPGGARGSRVRFGSAGTCGRIGDRRWALALFKGNQQAAVPPRAEKWRAESVS